MGMTDDMIVEYELPVPNLPTDCWQTKSFACDHSTFVLNKKGRLLQGVWGISLHDDEVRETGSRKYIDRNFEGEFSFHGMILDVDSGNNVWYDFDVVMIDGVVRRIRRRKISPETS